MNIRNHWNVGRSFNRWQCLCVFFCWHSDPNDFASCFLKLVDLLDCASNIAGIGRGHRLDDNWRIATDWDSTYLDLAGFSAF